MNIMLVDDDRDCLQGLTEVLAPTGFACVAFDDPEKAVQAYRQKPYDLVISDMKMPKMNGIQVLKAVRACNDKARVIIVSGYSEMEMLMEALNQRAYAFFTKPVNVGKLLDTIENVALEIEQEAARAAEQRYLEEDYQRLKQELLLVTERMGTAAQ